MTQTINATTTDEFWAVAKALDFLAKNPMRRDRNDQSMLGVAVVRFGCFPETRTVNFTFNADALQSVGIPVPDTANGVIATAIRAIDQVYQPSLDGMTDSLKLRVELAAHLDQLQAPNGLKH